MGLFIVFLVGTNNSQILVLLGINVKNIDVFMINWVKAATCGCLHKSGVTQLSELMIRLYTIRFYH